MKPCLWLASVAMLTMVISQGLAGQSGAAGGKVAIFPALTGTEKSLGFVNKSIADQLPQDRDADVASQVLFSIGTSLYNSRQFENAAAKFNEFFWDAGARRETLPVETIDWVLMWRAYALSELGRQQEAQDIHEYRLRLFGEDPGWKTQLPPGLAASGGLTEAKRSYAIAVIHEELSITHFSLGELEASLDELEASQGLLSTIGAYKKAVDVGLVMMNNAVSRQLWNLVGLAWGGTWPAMKALMVSDEGVDLQAYPEGYVQMHRFLFLANVNLNYLEQALQVSDRLVGFEREAGYEDERSAQDLEFNAFIRQELGIREDAK